MLHDALMSAGPQASAVETLWWVALWAAVAMYALTMGALAVALLSRPRAASAPSPRTTTGWVSGAVGLTIVVLFAFLAADLVAARTLEASMPPRALTVRVTGYQWWWRVEYVDSIPARQVTTANEIHIPTGVPVQLELLTADVIHSFWVPSLAGKRDLLPHHRNRLWIRADRPGTFRGQCAEFCGYQHANMAMTVVAHAPADYTTWYERQRAPVDTLTLDRLAASGRRLFEGKTCVMCHTIRGTAAGGAVAPELTHVASRRTIASGALPNTPAALLRWITDPQGVKPGTRMPATPLTAAEASALVAYLSRLR